MPTHDLSTSLLCSYVHTHTHTYAHTHIHIHTYAHTHMQYIGTFSIEMQPSWKNDIGKAVKHHLSKFKTKVLLVGF